MIKKVLIIVFIVCAAGMIFSASEALADTWENIEYDYTGDGTVMITGYDGPGGDFLWLYQSDRHLSA